MNSIAQKVAKRHITEEIKSKAKPTRLVLMVFNRDQERLNNILGV